MLRGYLSDVDKIEDVRILFLDFKSNMSGVYYLMALVEVR